MLSLSRTTTQYLFNSITQLKPINCGGIMVPQQMRFRYQYLRNRPRVKRDILRHQAVCEFEIPRLVLKSIQRDQRLDAKTRLRAMLALQNLHSYTFVTGLKPRCVETGRGNGLIQGFGISRIVFREAAINGHLSGVQRAIW